MRSAVVPFLIVHLSWVWPLSIHFSPFLSSRFSVLKPNQLLVRSVDQLFPTLSAWIRKPYVRGRQHQHFAPFTPERNKRKPLLSLPSTKSRLRESAVAVPCLVPLQVTNTHNASSRPHADQMQAQEQNILCGISKAAEHKRAIA